MTRYAILGGGRLARHMSHYFSLLDLPVSCWARDRSSPLNTHSVADRTERLRLTVQSASHVLLLVSDAAIPGLLKKYPFLHEKKLLHCSGALSFPGATGVHPLMTFSHDLYTLADYQRIPFMVDEGHTFSELLPGLPNPNFPIKMEDKPKYHALCVMAGNFSQILWQATLERFSLMNFPAAVLEPYLQQLVQNFLSQPETALTGPLSRGDQTTVELNIKALAGDPLQAVYQGFVDLYHSSDPAEHLRQLAR